MYRPGAKKAGAEPDPCETIPSIKDLLDDLVISFDFMI